jgi:hypothetical protein
MVTLFFPLQSRPKCNGYIVLSVSKLSKWNGYIRSSCLKTPGRSHFFVPSRFMKVVVCNDHFKRSFRNGNEETMKWICAHLSLWMRNTGAPTFPLIYQCSYLFYLLIIMLMYDIVNSFLLQPTLYQLALYQFVILISTHEYINEWGNQRTLTKGIVYTIYLRYYIIYSS